MNTVWEPIVISGTFLNDSTSDQEAQMSCTIHEVDCIVHAILVTIGMFMLLDAYDRGDSDQTLCLNCDLTEDV